MEPKQKNDFIVLNRIEGGKNVAKVEIDRKSIITSGRLLKEKFRDVKKYKAVWVSPDLHEELEKL